MSRYHIWTIGCQMNKADSEHLGASLEQLGYQATTTPEDADIIVVNSCVVRQSAENRAVSKLGSLKPLKRSQKDPVIALTGCMVDSEVEQLSKRFPHVDIFLKPQAFTKLLELARERTPTGEGERFEPFAPSPTCFVPIIHGCDNFCSYCVVPYRRGREKSRPMEDILCQVERFVERGGKEVTLLGQNVNSYGHDLPSKPDLVDLLEKLSDIEQLARIRFLTCHPKDMSHRLIQAVARLDKVCNHISLPMQAGDDAILKAMRRDYTASHYLQLIEQIRKAIPEVALSTDVIVGFPSETEAQFQKTADLLRQLGFDTVHVAAYSPRPGTISSKLEDNVPLATKKERLQIIEELQEKIASEINARLLGKTVEILVEGEKKGKWQGRSQTNKLVFFSDAANCLGQLVKIRIEKTSPWSLQGRLLERC